MYIHIHTNIYSYIYTYICINTHIYLHIYMYMHKYKYIYICTNTYIYICMYIYIYIYIYVYIHIYMYTYVSMYVYICIYIHTSIFLPPTSNETAKFQWRGVSSLNRIMVCFFKNSYTRTTLFHNKPGSLRLRKLSPQQIICVFSFVQMSWMYSTLLVCAHATLLSFIHHTHQLNETSSLFLNSPPIPLSPPNTQKHPGGGTAAGGKEGE